MLDGLHGRIRTEKRLLWGGRFSPACRIQYVKIHFFADRSADRAAMECADEGRLRAPLVVSIA
jgi:hypothetical protein